jgi:hypothetical protein
MSIISKRKIMAGACIIIGLLAYLSHFVHAGGTISTSDDIVPILSQRSQLKDAILDTFELSQDGWSFQRIGGVVNSELGGARVGPYQVLAKRKGSKGNFTFEIILHTKSIFLDRSGKQTSLEKGVKIVETLASVEIREAAAISTPHERESERGIKINGPDGVIQDP